MNTEQFDKQLHLSLKIIAYSLLISQALFLFVSLLLHQEEIVFNISKITSFMGILILILSGAVAFFFIQYSRKNFSHIRAQESIERKKTLLISVILVRYALLAGYSMIAVMIFMATANLLYLVFAVISIVIQIQVFPNKERVARRLQD